MITENIDIIVNNKLVKVTVNYSDVMHKPDRIIGINGVATDIPFSNVNELSFIVENIINKYFKKD